MVWSFVVNRHRGVGTFAGNPHHVVFAIDICVVEKVTKRYGLSAKVIYYKDCSVNL